MNESVKYILENELSGNVKEALSAAALAIYFNDNSDYLSALYNVVVALLDGTAPERINVDFIDELVYYLNPDLQTEEG